MPLAPSAWRAAARPGPASAQPAVGAFGLACRGPTRPGVCAACRWRLRPGVPWPDPARRLRSLPLAPSAWIEHAVGATGRWRQRAGPGEAGREADWPAEPGAGRRGGLRRQVLAVEREDLLPAVHGRLGPVRRPVHR